MKDTDAKDFLDLLIASAEIVGKTLSSTCQQMYFNSLKMYELNVIRAAFNAHITDPDQGQYFATPAHIIKKIEGGGEEQALLAWSKFYRALQIDTQQQSIIFDDWKIHQVIYEMGNWQRFKRMEIRNEAYVQIEFVRRYRATNINRYFPEKLKGDWEKIIFIGEKEKAKNMLNGKVKKIDFLMQS